MIRNHAIKIIIILFLFVNIQCKRNSHETLQNQKTKVNSKKNNKLTNEIYQDDVCDYEKPFKEYDISAKNLIQYKYKEKLNYWNNSQKEKDIILLESKHYNISYNTVWGYLA